MERALTHNHRLMDRYSPVPTTRFLMRQRLNLLNLDKSAMRQFFVDMDEKAFRATQVIKWVHQLGVDDFEQMTNLSKPLRSRLSEVACISSPEITTEQVSADGTRKWLIRVDDHNCVETVFIPEPGRGTLCVSSQVGCPLDCSFCSTAKQGFNRNLSTAEIIGQLRIAIRRLKEIGGGPRPITNVVFMGMGEPLLNFDNVASAISLMADDQAYGLGWRRVTLSTAGVVPGIDRLSDVDPVSLAISLHAPYNALRDQLVPINRKYPIEQLMAACQRFAERCKAKKSQITFEYVMLKGINDNLDCAHALAALLRDFPAKVNLIPFNRFSGCGYERSTAEVIDHFRDILSQAGTITITRKTRGDDIDAACGQLVGEVVPRGIKHRHTSECQEAKT